MISSGGHAVQYDATRKRLSPAAETRSVWRKRTGMFAFALSAGPSVRIRLWRSQDLYSVKSRPDQREVLILLLGLLINPSYLELAHKSLLPVLLAQGPGMLLSQLTMILPPNTERDFLPPPWSSCLLSSGFSLLSLSLQGPARLLAWLEGVEKSFQNPLAREPQIYFWCVPFFFFFENKKATGRNRQYWGVGGLFFIWPGLPSVLPLQHQPQHYGEQEQLRLERRSVFPCKTTAKLWSLILEPCHLATIPTCFPLAGHMLVFQSLLCFDLFQPFSTCLKLAMFKSVYFN